MYNKVKHGEVKCWCLFTLVRLCLVSNLQEKINNQNLEKVYLVVCGCLWLFAGGLWSFAGGLWSFAGGLVIHSYTLHSQSYRNHVKEILENFKVPLSKFGSFFFFEDSKMTA